MKSLKEKIVLITGASSGIGQACAKIFAENGANLLLSARKIEPLADFSLSLQAKYGVQTHVASLDVRDKNAVKKYFDQLPAQWKKIDILINNAGLALGLEKFQDGNTDDWDTMIDTNIKGLLYLTRQTLPLMLKHHLSGHIINIGSLAGLAAYPLGSVYCATKAAVRFISDGLRMDLIDKPIRVTNIQPGMVETNFSVVRFHGDKQKANEFYRGIEALTALDVAETVFFAASRPNRVQICEITLTPIQQATGGVVYRKP